MHSCASDSVSLSSILSCRESFSNLRAPHISCAVPLPRPSYASALASHLFHATVRRGDVVALQFTPSVGTPFASGRLQEKPDTLETCTSKSIAHRPWHLHLLLGEAPRRKPQQQQQCRRSRGVFLATPLVPTTASLRRSSPSGGARSAADTTPRLGNQQLLRGG